MTDHNSLWLTWEELESRFRSLSEARNGQPWRKWLPDLVSTIPEDNRLKVVNSWILDKWVRDWPA